MPKKSSNLVPTRIVNKNGISTTVHRKPAQSDSKSSRIPSPAAVKAPSESYAEKINARLTKLPHVSDETMLNASKSFFKAELGELSYRLLNSGSATGQRLAAESLSFYVGRLADHLHKSGKTSDKTTPFSGSLIHSEIIRKWNYGNLREETGFSPDAITKDDLEDLKYAHSMVTTSGLSSYDDIPEEAHYTMTKELETHWRGISVLALCFDFQDESNEANEEWEKFDDFIPWAASRTNIGTVISVAKKHRVIDPDKLERLLEAEASGVHGSTIEGWL